jgi:hypothetical protein
MTLPFVPRDIFIADVDTLAEAFEGEVGSVRQILRMFEASFRRLFLKFERFSSLRKSSRDGALCARQTIARAVAVAESHGRSGSSCVGNAPRVPWRGLHSARDRSPFETIPAFTVLVFVSTHACGRLPPVALAFI